MRKILIFSILFIGACVIAACRLWTSPPGKKVWLPKDALKVSATPQLGVRARDAGLVAALKQSIKYLKARSPGDQQPFGPHQCQTSSTVSFLQDLVTAIESGSGDFDYGAWLQEHGQAYVSAAESVLITGYYEAELSGSRSKSSTYKYPLYRKPDDLLTLNLSDFISNRAELGLPATLRGRAELGRFLPYPTREEIDFQGALENRNLELVYVSDPVEAFFLHIQGSGVITLDTGGTMRVNYAESNGRPYRAIANWFVKQKGLSPRELNAEYLVKYLNEHPDEQQEIFSFNPSYVFFNEVSDGPLGSIGRPLTAQRSIATDSGLFPKAALALVRTKVPIVRDGTVVGFEDFESLVMNQDTGGAIKGPGRVDLFMGSGKISKLKASHMQEPGELYFFGPKGCS